MPATHTAVFKAVAVTVQQDFYEILAPTTGAVIIHGWVLSQLTEVADAAEEMLTLTTNRGSGAVTSGSVGTVATATAIKRTDSAFSGTIEVNNTTKLVVGTGTLTTDLEVHNWNVRVPYMMWYTPETRPIILAGDRWTLELETTPADSITMSSTIWLELIG